MGDPGDYQLDPFDTKGSVDLDGHTPDRDPAGRRRWIALALVLVAVVAGWAVWRFVRDRQPEAETPVVAAPQAEVPMVPPAELEPADLPPLSDSDGWVRDVVGQLSANPWLATWLVNDNLVRRVVAAADNMVEGVSPRSHLGFLKPSGEFSVAVDGDRLVVDPAAYRRYDNLAGVIGSLHVDGTAQVYRNVKPLLDAAYRDLGYPDGDFDVVAARLVGLLLATPVVYDAEVERFASSYKYADPRLEGLSEAQKHLLRLGPDNLSKVQSQVRRIAQRAGLSVD